MCANRHSQRAVVAALAVLFGVTLALSGEPRHHPRRHPHRAAAPAWRDDSRFRLGIGLFRPDAESAFWDETFSVFTGSPSELEDVSVSADLIFRRSRWSAVLVSLEHEQGSVSQAYRFDPDGYDVFHETRLRITPLTVGFLFYPAGDHRIAPYFGFGGGLYWWRYSEAGDFLWPNDSSYSIEFLALESDGVTAGYYFLAGLNLPVDDEWSLYLEARWQRADDELNRDLEGWGTIDLSGRSLRAGVSWRF